MKLFPAHWPGFLDELVRWGELSIEARRAFLDGIAPGLSIDPVVGGAAVAELRDAGFLEPSRRGELLGIAEDRASFHQVLKSLARYPIFERPGLAFLSAYLGEHYTPQERSQIHESTALLPNDLARVAGLVSSVEWLRSALGGPALGGPALGSPALGSPAPRVRSGPDGPRPRSGVPAGNSARALQCARRLLGFFTEQRDRITLRDLEEYFPGVPREELCDGVRLGMQRCLFYLGLRHADLEPLVGIWPAASRRLRRLAVVLAPEPVRVEQLFGHPFLVEDMASLLVSSRGAPIPLRRGDEKPFTRFVEETAGMILTLPAWLETLSGLALENRIDLALQALRITGLLAGAPRQAGRPPADTAAGDVPGPLAPGPEADRWIRLGVEERRDYVVERLAGGDAKTRLFDLLEEDWVSPSDRQGEILPWLRQAFSSLPSREFIRFSDFAEHQAAIGGPLAEIPGPAREGPSPDSDAPEFASEEAMEELWKSFLGVFLGRCLLSLGGAEAGLAPDGKPGFRLTDTGRRLLGLPREALLPADDAGRPDETPLVVQPNFEVVFLSPSAEAEAELGRFCERIGRGIGVLFRITRPALQRAASAGIGPQQVISLLVRRSRNPLPANVEHEVRGWAGS